MSKKSRIIQTMVAFAVMLGLGFTLPAHATAAPASSPVSATAEAAGQRPSFSCKTAVPHYIFVKGKPGSVQLNITKTVSMPSNFQVIWRVGWGNERPMWDEPEVRGLYNKTKYIWQVRRDLNIAQAFVRDRNSGRALPCTLWKGRALYF